MNICMVYVYAGIVGPKYVDYAKRFVSQYKQYPPGIDHRTVVALNGVKVSEPITAIFDGLPNLQFMEHDNSGYDIGAFQHAAREYPCDMMLFFGASTYLTRPGWLQRMGESFVRHGEAIYGTMGNRGDIPVKVWPHIRTTAFWMSPKLMNEYPIIVKQPQERHPFEHGPNCLTGWVTKRGLKAWVVTWTTETEWAQWDSTPNGFQRGDESDLIAGDHICEPPYYPRILPPKAPRCPRPMRVIQQPQRIVQKLRYQ